MRRIHKLAPHASKRKICNGIANPTRGDTQTTVNCRVNRTKHSIDVFWAVCGQLGNYSLSNTTGNGVLRGYLQLGGNPIPDTSLSGVFWEWAKSGDGSIQFGLDACQFVLRILQALFHVLQG